MIYRVFFDERVYVKDLALLKGLLLRHDQVFNLIFSSAQRQYFSLVRLKGIIFFLTMEYYEFWQSGLSNTWYRQKNKYRGIGEVQAPDKCSAQQNTTVKRL